MHTNHEIEYKTLISESLFHKLCAAYPEAIVYDQTNVYYESESMSLKSMGFAIRIRDLDGKHLFTMKQKANQGHQEYELYLDENTPQAFNHPELNALFQHFCIQGPFKAIGSLHTLRRSIRFSYGELCLDENEYCGIKDYEIEFEIDAAHPKEAEQEFNQLLDRFQITYMQAEAKRTRCLHQRKKENI